MPSMTPLINKLINKEGAIFDAHNYDKENEELDSDEESAQTFEAMKQWLCSSEGDNENEKQGKEQSAYKIGDTFDEIKSKMTSIYNNGDVLKYVEKEGVGNVVPGDAQVTIVYAAFLECNDGPFDCSHHRSSKDIYRLGPKGILLPGLDFSIQTMKKSEISYFLIKPNLAFRKLGSSPRIPPDSEVLFRVELIDFLDNGSIYLYEEMTNEEKRNFSIIKKMVTDLLLTVREIHYKNNKVKVSINEYRKAITWLSTVTLKSDEEKKEFSELLTKALINLMICYNKTDRPRMVCEMFEQIENPESSKAFYNYGKALKKLGDYDKAMSILQKAYKISPKDEMICKEIKEISAIQKKYKDSAKIFARNSFKDITIELTPFEKDITDVCEKFKKSDSKKIPFPEALTEEEESCVKKIAYQHGLTVKLFPKDGRESYYLVKK